MVQEKVERENTLSKPVQNKSDTPKAVHSFLLDPRQQLTLEEHRQKHEKVTPDWRNNNVLKSIKARSQTQSQLQTGQSLNTQQSKATPEETKVDNQNPSSVLKSETLEKSNEKHESDIKTQNTSTHLVQPGGAVQMNQETLRPKKLIQEQVSVKSNKEPSLFTKPNNLESAQLEALPPKHFSTLNGSRSLQANLFNDASSQIKKAGGILLGALAGEFNNDPTVTEIVIDGIISLVPILDQIADGRDVAAHLYFMIAKGEYQKVWRWIGLAFSLIGCVPELGTAIKSASKLLFKVTAKALPDLKELLQLIGKILPNGSVSSFKSFMSQNWDKWVLQGIAKWNEILNQLYGTVSLIPGVLLQKKNQVQNVLRAIQSSTPKMLKSAFDTIWQKISKVLDGIANKLNPQRKLATNKASINVARKATELPAAILEAKAITEANDILNTPIPVLLGLLNVLKRQYSWIKGFEAKPTGKLGIFYIWMLASRHQISRYGDKAAKKRLNRLVEINGLQIRGFKNAGEIIERVGNLRNRLIKLGLDDVEIAIRGSSVTGLSSKGDLFRWTEKTGGLKPSDVDFFFISPKLEEKVKKLGGNFVSGRLKPETLKQLFPEIANTLTEFSQKTTTQIGRKADASLLQKNILNSLEPGSFIIFKQ